MKLGRILGTVRRGRTKIRSPRQMRFLHANRIDHTHFKKNKKGKTVKVRHTYLIVAIGILLAMLASVPSSPEVQAFPVHTEFCAFTWNTVCFGYLLSGTGSNTWVSIVGSEMRLNAIAGTFGGAGGYQESAVSPSDFNLTARYNYTAGYMYFGVFLNNDTYSGPGQTSVFFYRSVDGLIHAYYGIGGSITEITNWIPASASQEWLRLTRLGNTFTFYESLTGASYTQKAQTIQSFTPVLHPVYAGERDGAHALNGVWLVLPQSDFTIASSISSTTFRVNDIAHTTISASGKLNFSGYVVLSSSSTMFGSVGITVVCFPASIRINVTTSDCTLNSMFAGRFNVTITGTNVTIGKTHSIFIDVTVLATIVPPTLDTNALSLILFLVAIVILSFIAVSYHPAFFIPDGLVIVAFGFFTYTALSSLILAGVFVASGAFVIALGAFARPKPKNPIR